MDNPASSLTPEIATLRSRPPVAAAMEREGLMKWFDDIWKEKAKHYVHGYVGQPGPALATGESYLTIDVAALWIPYVRKGLTKFYGAVHGTVDVPSETGDTAKFQLFDVLADAKEMDASHLDRVIQGPFRLLDAVPYRGGGVNLRAGLFSVKGAELTLPYLNLLKSMSAAAGIAFISQALPFVELIRNGVSMIAGGDQLEIGRSGLFDPIQVGIYAIIRATSEEVSLKNLTFAENTRALLNKGAKIESQPYMVIRIAASPERPYFYSIPEVKSAFHQMKQQFQRAPKDFEDNNRAFDAFEVTTRLSPDLLAPHAKTLIAQVRKTYEAFLVEGRRSGTEEVREAHLGSELEHFNPFAE